MVYLNIYIFVFVCVFFSFYFYFINEIMYYLFKPYLCLTQNSIFLYKKLLDIYILKYQVVFYLLIVTILPFCVFLIFYLFRNMFCVKHNIFLNNILLLQLYIYILFHVLLFILSFFLIYYLLLPNFTQSNQLLNFRFELFLYDFFNFYWYTSIYGFSFYFFCYFQIYYYVYSYTYLLYNKCWYLFVYVVLLCSLWTPFGDITSTVVLPVTVTICMVNLFIFYFIFNFVISYLLRYYKYLIIY